jgi:ATP synthase protein I
MAEDRRQLIKSLGFLSSVGICMVASCLIGLAMGFYLDRWLGTSPWLTLVFLGFGIASGFRNIFILTNRELRRQEKEGRKDSDGPG